MNTDYRALIGRDVIVQNPNSPDTRWMGRAVAIATDPSIVIEQENGRQVTLPLAWATRDS